MFTTVTKSFTAEATRAFDFLADEFGFYGPDYQITIVPCIAFTGFGLRYRIRLDPDDRAVITRLELDLDDVRLIADLDKLVAATGLGSTNNVARSAHSVHGLRKALDSQAHFVRLLQPFLAIPDRAVLFRRANAREWNLR